MPKLTEVRKTALDAAMRDAIYAAAVTVLTDHGNDGLTMDRVAGAANLAKGSLYNYFRSKKALLHFVYERSYEPISRQLDAIAESDRMPSAKLEAIARMYFEYVDTHRGLFDFLLNDASVRGQLKTEQDSLRAHAIVELTRIVEQGIATGDFKPLDAGHVAEALLGAVRQLAERQLASGQMESVDETVGMLLQLFLGGLSSGQR